MYNITVFTIAYNGYGKFIDDWYKMLRKQTNPPKEIIVVLGKNHGYTVRQPGIKYIECDSDVMGTLRNEAIKAKRFKKCLYFSVDDYLYPTAIMEIEKKFNQGYQVVGLRYFDSQVIGHKENFNGTEEDIRIFTPRNSFIGEPGEWRKSGVPGWVAVNGTYKYEDIEVPNYPYIFKLKQYELPMAITDEVIATYTRRKGSHGDIAKEGKFQADFVERINGYLKWQFTET